MAKYKFSQSKFDDIYSLLKKRSLQSRDEQKKTRAKIRKLGFRISDYHNGFSEYEFKKLLETGEIEIDEQITFEKPVVKKDFRKQIISESKNNISKQSLPPIIDRATEYLVLGTMPGERSLLNQEYYNNPKNQFWSILSSIYNEGKQFIDYQEKLKILAKNKIGLWDVLDTCIREGSLDSNIVNYTFNDFDTLFNDFPNIKIVIFNGQESYRYFNSLKLKKGDKLFRQLSSTSSANTHKSLEEKIQEWKAVLKSKE